MSGNFRNFKEAVRKQFDAMASGQLFTVMLDKEEMWKLYLDSFPPGVNELYRTRREYDCNCCKNFIRHIGNVVAIDGSLKLISIWDVKVDACFQPVADAMSAFVRKHAIQNQFLSKEPCAGTDVTRQIQKDTGTVISWDHFHVAYPKRYIHGNSAVSIESVLGTKNADYQVFSRSMQELTLDAGQTVLELIDAGSIYRGEEHRSAVQEYIKEKMAYDRLSKTEKAIWCWTRLGQTHVTRIRNTALGTLLIDLSENVDVDVAVSKFEKVMAPANYKRPKAIYTKKMVEEAEARIKELGFEDSIARRHAVIEDITVNNVLFVDRAAKKAMGVFDALKSDVAVNPKTFKKVDEIGIDDFVANILPHASMLEIMPDNTHEGNLMSLVAPVNRHAPSMFKWDNNFSWSYNGDVADSMKTRVKAAGGRVDGVLRFSIQWNENNDCPNDFDAHCIEPNSARIYFGNKYSGYSGGRLDVDIMRPEGVAVENITWLERQRILKGTYTFLVHNYNHRGGSSGFRAEIEYDGEVHSFSWNRDLKQGQAVEVAKVTYDPKKGFSIEKSLDSTASSKEMWGVKTGNFVKVTSLMMSPNYWDGQKGMGNRHFFFILEGCRAGVAPRSFYNEFLRDDLMKHRQVFEALGSKMRVEPCEQGLSGLGFSSTVRNSIVVRVTGSVSRVMKINF